MSPISQFGPVSTDESSAGAPLANAPLADASTAGWRARFRQVSAVMRRIIGVPDYDAYLAHMHRHFPDCTPMDVRTFERERMADKYTQPGSRCC